VVAVFELHLQSATLKDILPEAYQQFVDVSTKLETNFKDMQDIEFTIENGKLYLLQTP
jgi:pyruvate,orthophosphate dikinase